MTDRLVYHQGSGKLVQGNLLLAFGYSGAGEGKNNPAMETVRDVGPIPKGCYFVGPPHDTAEHGPFVLTLTPDPSNEMHGRAGFLVHGDSKANPGTASKGCIILRRSVRELIAKSADKSLWVEE